MAPSIGNIPGGSRIDAKLEALIVRTARGNSGWGHQAPPLQNFHREEVRSGQRVHVRRQEISPRHRSAALGRWSYAVTAKNVTHGLIRNRVTQVGQSADEAVIAPAGVFPRHPDDQSFQLCIDSGPPGDNADASSRRTFVRSASDTRLGSCQVWPHKRFPAKPSCLHALRSRPG